MKTLMALEVALGLAAVAACARQQNTPPAATVVTSADVTTTSAADSVTNDQAIDKITAARCAREHACNNIGPDRQFESYEACTRQLRDTVRAMLRSEDCPNGVGELDLSSCLSDIHSEREHCAAPFDKVDRLPSCRRVNLCR